AIDIALAAAIAQRRLGERGTAIALEILPGRISDTTKPPRPWLEGDDRPRRKLPNHIDFVDDAAGWSHVDDQIVVMLKCVAHQSLCRSALAYARGEGDEQYCIIGRHVFVEPGRGQLAGAKAGELTLIDHAAVAAHCPHPSKASRL